MSIEAIIEKIKEIYAGHSDLEEMVTDLSEGGYKAYWGKKMAMVDEDFPQNIELARELYKLEIAEKESEDEYADIIPLAREICNEDILNDKEWAKELLVQTLPKIDDASDILAIADIIVDEDMLNDKEWATELYKKVEEQCTELPPYNTLIRSLNEIVKDKEWTKRVTLKAKDALIASEDRFAFANFNNDMEELAKFIADEDGLDDKECAKEVFDLIKEYEAVTALLDGSRAVKEIYEESDAEYSNNFIAESLDRAIEFVDEGYYCDIYNFIKDDMEDEDRADEYKDEYYDEMESDHQEYEGCEELFDNDSMDVDEIEWDDFEDDRKVIGFTTNNITFGTAEDLADDDNNISEESAEIVGEKVDEFIDAVREKFENNIEDKILITINNELKEYDASLLTSETAYSEDIILYMVVTKDIPADIVNALLLDLDEYGFYALMNNEDADAMVIQGYDFGEYDTGYFSHDADDVYINNFKYNWELFIQAKESLLGE